MDQELLIYVLLIVFAGVLSLILCLFSYVKLKNAPSAGTTHYHVRFSPVLKKGGANVGTIITFVNVTERVEMQKKLHQLASYDGLTQIYNRVYFMKQAVNALASLMQKEEPASLILFDIDHFKSINDTYGHEAGDVVLANIARLAESSLGPLDVLGRYGGEEFIILLPGRDAAEVVEVADMIRMKISESLFRTDDKEIAVTSSFGVSLVLTDQPDPKEAIKLAVRRADQALYAAKDSGRNNVRLYKAGSRMA